MKPKSFTRGNVIYKEGDRDVNSVYFITSGEFEVTKAIVREENAQLNENG